MRLSLQLGPVVRQLRGHRAAALLITLQLALGGLIAAVAGQVGSFMHGMRDPQSGLAEQDISVVRVLFPGARAEPARVAAARDALLATVRAVPGVVAVTTTDAPPMATWERSPDELMAPGGGRRQAFDLGCGPGAAAAFGLELVAGRDLSAAEIGGAVAPAIVARTVADALFPGQDPIGRWFYSRAHGAAMIVGVARAMWLIPLGDVASGGGMIYGVPAGAAPRLLLVARSAPGEGQAVRARLRSALAAPAGGVLTVDDILGARRALRDGVNAGIGLVSTIFAAIVAIVLLGSVAFTYTLVAQRRREIGLRRALGAGRRDIVGHFMLENLLFTAAGLAIGAGLFAPMASLMRSAQEGFRMNWPLLAVTVGGFAALNLAATLVPAWRATRVSPSTAARPQEETWARS